MKIRVFLATLCLLSFSLIGQKNTPKLVVGIVVDQMSYDYLYRFYPHFSKLGFRKLMDQGSNFRNVNYNYVPTFTGPGHASIFTGTTPSNHGIVSNEFFYRPFNREVNCVEDTAVKSVGTTSNYGKRSPYFLRSNTITDQLKLTYPQSKVIGVSIKDRSAILPAGHLSNGSFWYDYATGRFVTSSFFMSELPNWVIQFNAQNRVLQSMKQPWNLLRDSSCYAHFHQDDTPYEVLLAGKSKPVFPYDFSHLSDQEKFDYFTVTPFANTFLADFAIQAMKSEALGKHPTTDFLTISFSTPDIVGHDFGPYSLELEDVYLRLDLEIAKLIQALEKQVGKSNFVLFLTADHAVVPVPQYLIDKQLPGGYLFVKERKQKLEQDCQAKFGKNYIQLIESDNVYLDKSILNTPQEREVIEWVKQEILKWSEVKCVYTKYELANQSADNWQSMTARGYDRERSGEIIFLLQPGYLPKSKDSEHARQGTSHGSAFNYDTHVPMLFYGRNIPKQDVFTPYDITDIAATLVHVLDVQRPNSAIGKPMVELFEKAKK